MVLGVTSIVFALGFMSSAIIFPHQDGPKTASESALFMVVNIGVMFFGSALSVAGLLAIRVRESVFRDRCPSCRHTVGPDDEACPECSLKLSVDMRNHFTLLAMANPDADGNCSHCGSEVRLARISVARESIPGQERCVYCGTPRRHSQLSSDPPEDASRLAKDGISP